MRGTATLAWPAGARGALVPLLAPGQALPAHPGQASAHQNLPVPHHPQRGHLYPISPLINLLGLQPQTPPALPPHTECPPTSPRKAPGGVTFPSEPVAPARVPDVRHPHTSLPLVSWILGRRWVPPPSIPLQTWRWPQHAAQCHPISPPIPSYTHTIAFIKPALPASPALAGDPEAGRGHVPGACTSQGRVLGGLRFTDEIHGNYHTPKFPPALTHLELRGILQVSRASLVAQSGKESACNAGDQG